MKLVVHLKGPPHVLLGICEAAIGVGELQFSRTEEEVDRRSEVEGFGVLVVQLDRAFAVVERQTGLALVEVIAA